MLMMFLEKDHLCVDSIAIESDCNISLPRPFSKDLIVVSLRARMGYGDTSVNSRMFTVVGDKLEQCLVLTTSFISDHEHSNFHDKDPLGPVPPPDPFLARHTVTIDTVAPIGDSRSSVSSLNLIESFEMFCPKLGKEMWTRITQVVFDDSLSIFRNSLIRLDGDCYVGRSGGHGDTMYALSGMFPAIILAEDRYVYIQGSWYLIVDDPFLVIKEFGLGESYITYLRWRNCTEE